MPQLTIRLDPAAAKEAEAARDWYQNRSPLAARAFVAELDSAMARILASPRSWPRIAPQLRRYLLPRFPFSVVYRIRDNVIEVLAIAHQKRKPGYWRTR